MGPDRHRRRLDRDREQGDHRALRLRDEHHGSRLVRRLRRRGLRRGPADPRAGARHRGPEGGLQDLRRAVLRRGLRLRRPVRRGRPRLRPRRDQRHERRRVLRHPAHEQEDLVDGHAPLPAEGQQGHARLVQRRHRRDARPDGRRPRAARPAAARPAARHADRRSGNPRGVQGDHAQADRRGLGQGRPRPRRRALPSRGDLPERADAAGRARRARR